MKSLADELNELVKKRETKLETLREEYNSLVTPEQIVDI